MGLAIWIQSLVQCVNIHTTEGTFRYWVLQIHTYLHAIASHIHTYLHTTVLRMASPKCWELTMSYLQVWEEVWRGGLSHILTNKI